jgi:hypothetical protein
LHIAVLQDLKPLYDFDTDREIVGNQGMKWDWGVKLEEVIKIEDVGVRCMGENDLFNPTFLAEALKSSWLAGHPRRRSNIMADSQGSSG